MTERLSALRELIGNPASNPTATAIGIGIIAVFLLLVIVTLLAWALPPSARPVQKRRKASRAAAPPSPARARAIRSLPLLLVLAAVAATYGMTSQSAFCGSTCHAMLPRGESWAKSAHADVPCVRCHEGALVLSAPSAVLTRGSSLFFQVTSRTGAGRSSVPSGRCFGCHGAIGRGVLVSKTGVAMSHEQVIAAGSACDDCHGAQGHLETGKGGPTMASCLRCHDGKKAAAACRTCHHTTIKTGTRIEDTRFGKVRLANKPTCEGCHPQDACDACHGLRMPHSVDYADPLLHARPAAFGGKDRLCYRCHTFKDCDPCHLPFDAHVDDWEHVHRKMPRNTLWCRGCHKTKDMCALCHGTSASGKR